GQQAAAELGWAAGHVQRGMDVHYRGPLGVGRLETGLHRRRRGTSAAGLLARRLERDRVVGLVLLGELGGPLVAQRERTQLDLDLARDLIALHGGDAGAGHARSDPLHVQQDIPGLLRGHWNGERVVKLDGHRTLLSRWAATSRKFYAYASSAPAI